MTAIAYDLDPEPAARGAQGAVYFGRRSDGLEVAVKVAAPGKEDHLHTEADMLRELGRAGVQGVVRCLDTLEVHGRPAMVMPRYHAHLGAWLHGVVQRPGPDTLDEVLARTAVIARILANVHDVDFRGGTLVHRDVKPENLFVDADGGVVLGDFGGALAIDRLEYVEMGMFGTPLWAPLDQILPGRAMPDPTWDTYALCTVLFVALTGDRPSYQADPTELLGARGRALWGIARRAIDAQGPARTQLRDAFAQERSATTAEDLLDLTGRAALVESDRQALTRGLDRLCDLADVPWSTRPVLHNGLWSLLSRALSPVSHPSPPNRFRDGRELAEQLEDLRALLERREDLEPRSTPGPPTLPPPPPRVVVAASRGPSAGHGVLILTAVATAAVLGAVVALLWYARNDLRNTLLTPSVVDLATSRVAVDGQDAPVVVAAFRLDRDEVTAGSWAACVADHRCSPLERRSASPDHPVMGVTAAEAAAFCRYVGGRLPTEAEWLATAGAGLFPWGDADPTCDRASFRGCPGPTPAARHARGAAPSGVRDLAGNVWEWVTSEQGPVLRGGGADSPPQEIGRTARQERPGDRPDYAGLRCAYPPAA